MADQWWRARRSTPDSAIASIDVDAVIDHVARPTRDSVSARLRGIRLPSFQLPGIPFQVAPGTATSSLNFSMRGTQLSGRWAVASNQVRWTLAPRDGRPTISSVWSGK